MQLRGRAALIGALVDGLHKARTLLLLGPLGAGKSTVLAAVAERLRAEGRPCGSVPRTASLRDMTLAAVLAYPELATTGWKQGAIRRALSQAMESRPPVLVLDGIVGATPPMRKYLHVLQGRGVGLLIAADSQNQRDHLRIRGLRLACREVVLPPLEARVVREILAPLAPAGWLDALAAIAHGNPGRAERAAVLAKEQRYWSNGALLRAMLETDLDMETARRAMITS
jgi:hypothetical protein